MDTHSAKTLRVQKEQEATQAPVVKNGKEKRRERRKLERKTKNLYHGSK